jgi:glycerophosphoryl diester phosphodiesterase
MAGMTQVIAHRGAPRRALENTIESFRAAVALGADAIELDARRTADGELVVHHDPFVDDGLPIIELDRAALPPHIPALADALDACRGVVVNVEIKNSPLDPDFDATDTIAADVVDLLRAREEEHSTWLVSSFRRETIDRCRAADPDIATAWLTAGVPGDSDIAWAAAAGHAAVHPWVPTVTRDSVERCHRAGLRVNVWTCNDLARAVELAGWGVDGICTDIPDELIAALR